MPLVVRFLYNLLYKIIVFPVIFYVMVKWLPEELRFASLQPVLILIGSFITIGLVADETVLPWLGNPLASFLGFLFMTAATWASGFLFQAAQVTLWGALAIGLALGVAEVFMHRWLLRQRAHPKYSF